MSQVSYGTITITDIPSSGSTNQHFWFNPTQQGTLLAGAYITDIDIDTFKSNKAGGYVLARSNGIEFGRGNYKSIELIAGTQNDVLNFYEPNSNIIDASLTTKGLVLSKGGIEAGTKNSSDYIYVTSSDDATDHTLAINNSGNKSDWRIVAGNRFGVDKAGNLYASEVNIAGIISATGGTIGGFKIDSTSIRTNDVAITSNADNSIGLSSADFTRTINGTSRSGLRFAIGDKFGVTGDGALYASGANISGVLTVQSGSNVYTKTESDNKYEVAGEVAKYITYISAEEGIKVHNTNDSSNYLQLNSTAVSMFKGGTEKIRLEAENLRLGDDSEYANINSNGLQVYQNDTSIASFGDTTIIGNTNRRNHIEIGDKYFYMKSNAPNANIFICFKDFREDNGKAKIKQNFTYSSGISGVGFFNLGATADSSEPIIIKVNDVETTSQLYVSGSRLYKKTGNTLQEGDQIYVEYYTNSFEAQAFTLGLREDIDNPLGGSPGIRSFTVGNNNIASGTYSAAFGYRNKASGSYSLASGDTNDAQGSGSVAFGQNNKAYGNYSGAIGSYLYTTKWNNLVCGMYNDNTSTANYVKRFEVGTGNYSDQRESGFFVTGSGETHLKTLYALASGITSGYDSYATWNAADNMGYSRLCKTGSSERYKEDISLVISESLQPKLLYNLPVRQFRYKEGVLVKEDPYNLTRPLVIGFIAEEVDKYFPAACVKQKGVAEDWNVRAMVPAMLSLIQEQHKQIEDLINRIKVLENK